MSNSAFKFDHVHIISKTRKHRPTGMFEMFGATITAKTMTRGRRRSSWI